jgi:hypothetical protein
MAGAAGQGSHIRRYCEYLIKIARKLYQGEDLGLDIENSVTPLVKYPGWSGFVCTRYCKTIFPDELIHGIKPGFIGRYELRLCAALALKM